MSRFMCMGDTMTAKAAPKAVEYLEITGARYLRGYMLHITFKDGFERDIDFGPFLAKARNPDTTDFRNIEKFKMFRVENGDLIWGDFQMIFPIADLYQGKI